MMIGNNIEYVQAYTEIKCLLKYFPIEYISKLPKKLLEQIRNKSDEKYNIVIDIEKSLQEQNISKKTRDILVVFKYNYWSSENEKEILKKKFYENEKNFQEKLSEKYNTNSLFKNKEKNIENVSVIEYKESWFSKIISKLKKFFIA